VCGKELAPAGRSSAGGSGKANGSVVVEHPGVADVAAGDALGLVVGLAHVRVERLAVHGGRSRETGAQREACEVLRVEPRAFGFRRV
jgi:hypothetical protein